MERSWIVDISFNGQNESEHLHLSNEISVSLDLEGMDQGETSEAKIYIDRDEIVIERVGKTEIEIERGNRRRQLRPSHPTRILPQDKIRMGTCAFNVDCIHRVEQPRRKASQIGQIANKVLLTGAAAIMMMSVPACNTKDHPNDATGQAVEQQNRGAENTGAKNGAISEEEALRIAEEEARIVMAQPQGEVAMRKECEDAEMCLSNNRYLQCNPGDDWGLIEECKKPATCRQHKVGDAIKTACENAEPCEDGQYACFGATINCEQNPGFGCSINNEMYKCVNHQWVLEKTCPSDKTCEIQSDNKAECVDYPRVMGKPAIGDACKDRQQKCDSGNAIMFCHWGNWRYKEICKAGETCKSVSDEKAVCEPVKPE